MAPRARFALTTLEFALYSQRRIEDVLSCLNCGRRSAATDRFCTMCGMGLDQATSRMSARGRSSTPTLQLRAIRSVPCPHCTRSIDREAPFCPHCGLRALGMPEAGGESCGSCGAIRSRRDATFCGTCGVVLPRRATPSSVEAAPRGERGATQERRVPRLAVIDANGEVLDVIPREGPRREGGQRQAPADAIRIAPLGTLGSMFYFLSEPHDLADGDHLLIGSQVVRFRLIDPPRDAPTPRATSANGAPGAAGAGSPAPQRAAPPPKDVAVLEQLRPDGSVRDALYVQEGRQVLIGRDAGDWVFPYDRTVSGRHAELAPSAREGASGRAGEGSGGSGWTIRDLGSRNGTAIAVRAPRLVRTGDRLLVGGQMLRVELA